LTLAAGDVPVPQLGIDGIAQGSPNRLMPSTVSIMATPGNTAIHGAVVACSSAPPCSRRSPAIRYRNYADRPALAATERLQAKLTLLGWSVGEVMKATGGKANPSRSTHC
jgi:hypothetical protein